MDIDSLMDDELLSVLFSRAGDELSNEDWLKSLGRAYQNSLDELDDKDFVVNPPQMRKFVRAFNFFSRIAKRDKGRIKPIKISPKERVGELEVWLPELDVYGTDIQEFYDVIKDVSVFGADAMRDGGVEVSLNIPDVFIHKDELK